MCLLLDRASKGAFFIQLKARVRGEREGEDEVEARKKGGDASESRSGLLPPDLRLSVQHPPGK